MFAEENITTLIKGTIFVVKVFFWEVVERCFLIEGKYNGNSELNGLCRHHAKTIFCGKLKKLELLKLIDTKKFYVFKLFTQEIN